MRKRPRRRVEQHGVASKKLIEQALDFITVVTRNKFALLKDCPRFAHWSLKTCVLIYKQFAKIKAQTPSAIDSAAASS